MLCSLDIDRGMPLRTREQVWISSRGGRRAYSHSLLVAGLMGLLACM